MLLSFFMFREQHMWHNVIDRRKTHPDRIGTLCKKVKSHTPTKTNKSLHTQKLSKQKKSLHTKICIYERKNKTRYRWGFKQSDSGQKFSPLSISRKIVASLN